MLSHSKSLGLTYAVTNWGQLVTLPQLISVNVPAIVIVPYAAAVAIGT